MFFSQALIKLLQLVRTDLDRERKSRIGVKGLSQSLCSQENQNVTDKLYHVRNILNLICEMFVNLMNLLRKKITN